MSIANRISETRSIMERLSTKYRININELKLLAVSKAHPADAIQAAYDAGITEFGESYLQEALDKVSQLRSLPITWHFIGPIQSNKTKKRDRSHLLSRFKKSTLQKFRFL